MRFTHVAGVLATLATAACAPGINYSLNSVPEEGGTLFTRITTEQDNLAVPEIMPVKTQGLAYYVRNPFDVAPDGRTIAFVGTRGGQTNVFLKSTQGGSATTQRTFRDNVFDVAYSPDGANLAFSDFRNQKWNVFEISSTTGSAIRQLTNFDQTSVYPAYNPETSAMMYVQHEVGSVGVTDNSTGATVGNVGLTRYYVWSLDLERMAHTQYAEGYAPAVAPGGDRLALTRNSRDHGNSEIWIVDLQTGTETLVISSAEQGYMQPSFSPDGNTLVFTGVTLAEASRPTNLDIFTIQTDGSNLTQLTFHPGNDLMGKFSPNGDSVYFLSQRGSDAGNYNIWRLEAR